MFSALRQGSVLYILEKGENPALKVGQVASITQPNYNNNFFNEWIYSGHKCEGW